MAEIYFNRGMDEKDVEELRTTCTNTLGDVLGDVSFAPNLTALTVTSDADAFAVADLLNGTVGRSYLNGSCILVAAGCSWGHGVLFTPLLVPSPDETQPRAGTSGDPVPSYYRPLAKWSPPPRGQSPVIALLDSGVIEHDQFVGPAEPPFWTPHEVPQMAPAEVDENIGPVKMAYGHGTFIAGLIRMQAPAAQVLSLKIMAIDGHISESALLAALDELISYERRNRLDVVCMAFGARLEAGETPPAAVREKLKVLSDRGVRLVAAAGNAGTDEKIYPAAFAPEIDNLDSVGAGVSEDDRDYYSGYGDWVTHWRNGTATSVMPGRPADQNPEPTAPEFRETAWAQWLGTSFATARRVCELANEAG
jgi:hypothetical protein